MQRILAATWQNLEAPQLAEFLRCCSLLNLASITSPAETIEVVNPSDAAEYAERKLAEAKISRITIHERSASDLRTAFKDAVGIANAVGCEVLLSFNYLDLKIAPGMNEEVAVAAFKERIGELKPKGNGRAHLTFPKSKDVVVVDDVLNVLAVAQLTETVIVFGPRTALREIHPHMTVEQVKAKFPASYFPSKTKDTE